MDEWTPRADEGLIPSLQLSTHDPIPSGWLSVIRRTTAIASIEGTVIMREPCQPVQTASISVMYRGTKYMGGTDRPGGFHSVTFLEVILLSE